MKEKKVSPNTMALKPINQAGVLAALGTVSENVKETIKDKKFKNNFMLKYPEIQKNVQKHMDKLDEKEQDVSVTLGKTEKGIHELKKPKPGGIWGIVLSPLKFIPVFTIVGGLILIALLRVALKKWVAAYLPPSDGKKLVILGVAIPGGS